MTLFFLFMAGLIIFLFGMVRLSNKMQQLFSARIRELIVFSVRQPIFGLIMGLIGTILFQSSSATTLLTVGLVSAGLISFYHSLGIMLGADIGTTITAQLVAWNVTGLSPILIFCGGVLYLLTKETKKLIGEALLYFGFIFFGLYLMGEATVPLKQSNLFINLFQEPHTPFLGIGIGILCTAIVQASSIPIAILVMLGQQGIIGIENALPIVLGANIGTTVTALLGSIAANINGKKSAVAHFLTKCISALLVLPVLSLFTGLITYLSSDVAQQVVWGHFIFNLFLAVIFMIFLKPFSIFVEKIIPGTTETLPLWPEFLDKRCLTKADDALMCVKKELGRQIMLSERMLSESLTMIQKFTPSMKKRIMYIEMVVDNLQSEIVGYLWNISCGELSPATSKKLFAFSTIVYDIERIADRATNLVELAESKYKRQALFSEAAYTELTAIGGLVMQNLVDTASLLEQRDGKKIKDVYSRHSTVFVTIRQAVENHLVRFYQKVCRAEAGPIFVDMLVNLEHISDHCRSIVERIEGLGDL